MGERGGATIQIGNTERAREVPLDLPELQYGSRRLSNVSSFLIQTLDSRTLMIRGATPTATLLGAVSLLR